MITLLEQLGIDIACLGNHGKLSLRSRPDEEGLEV